MPSADTFSRPNGSIRFTNPRSACGPPHWVISTASPGFTRTAWRESRSTTPSIRSGSPMVMIGVPSSTTPSLSLMTDSTEPLAGARTGTGAPLARPLGRARWAAIRRTSAWACARTARSAATRVRAASSWARGRNPSRASFCARCKSFHDCASAACAPRSAARAAVCAAASSAVLRGSSGVEGRPFIRVTSAPRATLSPASSSIRSRYPVTGADTT